LSAGASLITGVLCTQIYIQAVFSASTPATARKGALLSAILMPPLGLLGIIIGMSMRRTGASIQSSSALAHFIVSHFHPALGGLLWGGIMITVIGTAAGLTLGVATNMVSDLLHPFLPSEWGWKNSIWTVRVVILLLVLSAGSIGIAGHGSMILKWSYLSMGLRGSGIFFPMAAAIFSPGCLSPKFAIISGSAGIMTTILWPVAAFPGQPLFAGLAASAFFTLAGLYTGKGGSSPAGIH
jgi:SSS family solute:Na+ symporter